MTTGPEISVIVPSLNEEKYIESCLASLRSQEISRTYEIILGDGYSSDRTLEIASKYVDKVAFERKRTVGAGRQTAAKQAEGKVISFACADSYYPEDWLAELTRPIFDQGFGGAFGLVLCREGDKLDELGSKYVLAPTALILSKLGICFSPGETIALDHEVFKRVGGFNVDMVTNEDQDLVKRASKISRIAFNPRAKAYVSMRRVKKWGRLRYLMFHTANFLQYQILGRANKVYEPVR